MPSKASTGLTHYSERGRQTTMQCVCKVIHPKCYKNLNKSCTFFFSSWFHVSSYFSTCAMNCMHLCFWKTLSQDCPHGEIRQAHRNKNGHLEMISSHCTLADASRTTKVFFFLTNHSSNYQQSTFYFAHQA